MHPALRYLAFRQSAGGLKHRLSRLKNPRYFVPALLAIGYFWLSFGMPGLVTSVRDVGSTGGFERFRLFIGPGLGLMLAMGWAMAPSRPAPAFTRPEAAQLFVLPFKRRDLVAYRLLRPQLIFLMIGGFAALGSLRSPDLNPLFSGLGAFLLMNLLSFNAMAAALAANRMKNARLPGPLLYVPSILLLAWVLVPPLINYVRFASYIRDKDALLQSIPLVLLEGLPGRVHWPLRQLARMIGASDWLAFAGGAGAVLLACAVLYGICMLLVAPFEERALELAETTGRKVEAMRRGGAFAAMTTSLKKTRSTRLKLKPTGPAWRGVFWQTFVAEWRIGMWRLAIAVSVILLVLAAVGDRIAHSRGVAVFSIALSGAMGAMLLMMCPRMMATGMHTELRRLALWKGLPITGYALLRGKVWAGALLASVPGFIALSAAIIAALSVAKWDETLLILGVYAALTPLLPVTAVMMIGLESAAVLIMPAWLSSAHSEPGFETIGRNLLSLMVRMILGTLLSIIPGGLFAISAGIGYALHAPVPGLAIGGVAAAAALAGEMELLLMLTGRRFDTMDATPE
ncbi:MAG: hypothetical protein H6841_06455 [Planctomycetes bacterium]|nr:hypothetical protein [Planctomycetota bacterium]MCB9936190.1 hypothetical protein [Planctomycetota bacterium]